MTLQVDNEKIKSIIEIQKPKRVAFNAPEGLMKLTRDVARHLEEDYPGLESIVIADTTYGSCDTVDIDAERLGADVAFHLGHNVTVPKFGKLTYAIDVTDDVNFGPVIELAARKFQEDGIKKVGIVTFAQYVHQVLSAAKLFEEHGVATVIGKGMGQLHDGQIFGCEFYPAYNIRDKVDAMVLLGQSMFHALGLALSTSKRTFILDPYSNEIIDVSETAHQRLKRAILSVYKAKEAEKFGVIIGLKEGQIMVDQSVRIRDRLEKAGKTVQLLALREITSERLDSLTDIEAFVQTGCPRISVDGYTFSKPVLSVPQTEALFELLSGKEIETDILVRKHWL